MTEEKHGFLPLLSHFFVKKSFCEKSLEFQTIPASSFQKVHMKNKKTLHPLGLEGTHIKLATGLRVNNDSAQNYAVFHNG